MKPLRKHVGADSAWDAPDSAGLADDAWILLVPVFYADLEVLDRREVVGEPPRQIYVVDRKVLRDDDVRFGHTHPHVSETFVATLLHIGAKGWSTTPVPHASPLPVRGRALYALEWHGAPFAIASNLEMPAGPPRTPHGRPGFPTLPLVLDGRAGSGDPVGMTERCASHWLLPWQGLVVRGDFVRAFEALHGRRLRCGWEPAEIRDLAAMPAPERRHVPAPAQWTTLPTVAELVERIERGAARFDHQLPPAPDPVAACPPALRTLLTRWNGASLFGGALGFFALAPRSGLSELAGRHAHFGVPDNLDGAQLREDWDLAAGAGDVLFGWRAEEMPSIWAISPEGTVRLLSPGRVALGPALPVEAWLHDQLEDLEYAATNATYPATKWLGE